MKITNIRNITTSRKSKFSAFTLVELIVVITILVILGTIGFMSLSGYSGSARDSSRVSDLTNLSKGLDIAYTKTSSYPSPDNTFTVTYSGGILWYQGTIGDTVINTISAAGFKISKKPTDALNTTKEYTYSKIAFGNAYQLKADWEGDSVAFNDPFNPPYQGETSFLLSGQVEVGRGLNLISQAQAASGTPALAYIKGNYNGVAVQTQTGGMTYIVASPSIITSQIGATGSGFNITTSLVNKILINGSTNSGGINFTGTLVYFGASLPSTTPDQQAFATSIANVYSGTVLATTSNIQPFITAINPVNATTLTDLGESALMGWFGGKAGIPPQYPGCNTPDILVGGKYWAACNVGATTVSTSYVAGLNDSPLIEPESKRGKYFQWGEDVAWDYNGGITLTDACNWNRDTQACGTNVGGVWSSTISDITSGGIDRWNDWSITDTRGPCAPNYHVPTQSEWNTAYIALGSNRDTFASTLKLPMAGYRRNTDSALFYQGVEGNYWASSPSTTFAYQMYLGSTSVTPMAINARSPGFSIRCLKN